MNFNLTTYTTKAEVLAAVDRIRYLGQNTNTTGAFKLARLGVFEPASRERPYANRLAVLISDGTPTTELDQLEGDLDQLEVEVAAVKRLGVDVVAVGVTNAVIIIVIVLLSVKVKVQYLI